ncbi:C2H2 finger domain-containing protein [Blastomyces gilchristii SLH14081]|uniref:C2H2 finger domain-containing protein n=1 Tax=Blastomyces gilchristii (strain SLH14081) TaxID=559298 RepID=A0A179UMT6_BLAGS|nr:C2H2 finger domain-containing protein [Blastomyces gilchristii SLH14081]OAT08331.1 C2H2 finger domain-containing protein [Blastomyces gilchristii SLH14081]
MLALERSHHEQSYLQQLSMDPSMHDPFGSLNIDGYNHLGFNPFPLGTASFIETPSFLVEAPQHLYGNNISSEQHDNQKYDSYAHHPSASPSIATTLSSDLSASTSSSVSGPSLPSTSSSTIGSPYQDSWIDMNSASGLGPATVGSDGYPQEYVSAGMEADMMFAHEKLPDSFVGECHNAFSSVQPSQAPKLPRQIAQHVNISSVSASASSPVVDGHFGALSFSGFTWQHSDVASMASKNQPIQSMSPPTSTAPLAGGRSQRKGSTSGTSTRRSALASPVARSLSGNSPAMYSPEMPSRKRSLTQDSGVTTLEARKMSTAEARMKHRDSLHSPKRSSKPPGSRNREPFENSFFKQSSGNFVPPLESSYPSLIQPMQQQSSYPPPTASYAEEIQYAFTRSPLFHSTSPAASPLPQSQTLHPQQHPRSALPSPYLTQSFTPRPLSFAGRRSSISSENSRRSQRSPLAGSVDYEEKGKEKGRCPHPDCGRVFKDLKAHMLTHQSERPEKCPIVTCEYHLKGFSRKYDKNRHTLTHYKGTMVCGFCPGSGSAAEKSFNRADVFKRHLTSVHGVEQTAPNSRKKTPPTSNRKAATYCHDATGKCSTCSSTFSNAQEFYEHLDDCVLRVVQQEEPSEAINLKRLTEVASDDAVRQTMEKHMLVDTTNDVITNHNQTDDHDDDTNDSNDNNNSNTRNPAAGKGSLKSSASSTSTSSTNTNTTPSSSSNTLSKPPSTTHTTAGITKPRPTSSRRRNNRNNYPPSWGCATNKMKMKKRVLCLYDGQRRLWKDEMMLDNEFEVRLKLLGGANDDNGTGRDAYVTDLDVETLKRADAVHGATEEERGPWDGDMGGSAGLVGLMGPAAVPLMRHMPEGGMVDEVNIDELMA